MDVEAFKNRRKNIVHDPPLPICKKQPFFNCHTCLSLSGILFLFAFACWCFFLGLQTYPSDFSSSCGFDRHIFGNACLFASFALLALMVMLNRQCRTAIATKCIIALLSIVSILWGILGIIWSSHRFCVQKYPLQFTTSIISGAIFVLVCVPLLGLLLYYSLQSLSPENENSSILVCLRCSCWSNEMKRIVLLSFSSLLFGVSVTLLLLYQSQRCKRPFLSYIASCCVLFFAVLLHNFVYLFRFWQKRKKPYSAQNLEVVLSRTSYLSISIFLLFGGIALFLAILGSIWISHPLDCMQKAPQLIAISKALRIILYLFGCFTLSFTCCCRIETFLTSHVADNDLDVVIVPKAEQHSLV